MSTHEDIQEAPPAGEEIHMPSASLIPIINAAGVALMIISITLSIVPVILGAVIFVLSGLIWIRDARREYDELPTEHH